MSQRPLLLVDVDGVLNPYRRRDEPVPIGFAAHEIDGWRVLLSAEHGRWLHELALSFDIVWASTWEREANRCIGAVIGAPPDLPFLAFSDRDSKGWTWKLPAVKRFVGDRRVAWLDDDHGHEAPEWAAARPVPTLLVRPDGRTGWTRTEFEQLAAFAGETDEAE